MRISEAAKGVVTAGGGLYNIGFNGDDETQFTAYDLKELTELWRDFCEENGFRKNSVDYVERACRILPVQHSAKLEKGLT